MSKMLRLVSVCSEFRTQQALATVAWLAVALREDEKERGNSQHGRAGEFTTKFCAKDNLAPRAIGM